MVDFTRETVKIPSAESGVNLDVWLFKPQKGSAPFPLAVAGHGCVLAHLNVAMVAITYVSLG